MGLAYTNCIKIVTKQENQLACLFYQSNYATKTTTNVNLKQAFVRDTATSSCIRTKQIELLVFCCRWLDWGSLKFCWCRCSDPCDLKCLALFERAGMNIEHVVWSALKRNRLNGELCSFWSFSNLLPSILLELSLRNSLVFILIHSFCTIFCFIHIQFHSY